MKGTERTFNFTNEQDIYAILQREYADKGYQMDGIDVKIADDNTFTVREALIPMLMGAGVGIKLLSNFLHSSDLNDAIQGAVDASVAEGWFTQIEAPMYVSEIKKVFETQLVKKQQQMEEYYKQNPQARPAGEGIPANNQAPTSPANPFQNVPNSYNMPSTASMPSDIVKEAGFFTDALNWLTNSSINDYLQRAVDTGIESGMISGNQGEQVLGEIQTMLQEGITVKAKEEEVAEETGKPPPTPGSPPAKAPTKAPAGTPPPGGAVDNNASPQLNDAHKDLGGGNYQRTDGVIVDQSGSEILRPSPRGSLLVPGTTLMLQADGTVVDTASMAGMTQANPDLTVNPPSANMDIDFDQPQPYDTDGMNGGGYDSAINDGVEANFNEYTKEALAPLIGALAAGAGAKGVELAYDHFLGDKPENDKSNDDKSNEEIDDVDKLNDDEVKAYYSTLNIIEAELLRGTNEILKESTNLEDYVLKLAHEYGVPEVQDIGFYLEQLDVKKKPL